MNIKEYISSGILEQYVLGNLTSEEQAEVEQRLNDYPEIRQELEEIEEALEQYAVLNGRTAPEGTLDGILKKIDQSAKRPSTGSSANQLQATVAPFWRMAAIFLLGLFGLSAYFGYVYYQDSNRLQADLDQQQQRLDNVQLSCDSVQLANNQLRTRIDFLRDPNTRPIIMRGTDLSPQAVATVYFNQQNQQALLDVVDLPQPPTDKQYQLWAIVDGTPVDMGVFDIPIESADFKEIPFISGAQAFAVTLEDRGGNPTPTLEQMYVIGNS